QRAVSARDHEGRPHPRLAVAASPLHAGGGPPGIHGADAASRARRRAADRDHGAGAERDGHLRLRAGLLPHGGTGVPGPRIGRARSRPRSPGRRLADGVRRRRGRVLPRVAHRPLRRRGRRRGQGGVPAADVRQCRAAPPLHPGRAGQLFERRADGQRARDLDVRGATPRHAVARHLLPRPPHRDARHGALRAARQPALRRRDRQRPAVRALVLLGDGSRRDRLRAFRHGLQRLLQLSPRGGAGRGRDATAFRRGLPAVRAHGAGMAAARVRRAGVGRRRAGRPGRRRRGDCTCPAARARRLGGGSELRPADVRQSPAGRQRPAGGRGRDRGARAGRIPGRRPARAGHVPAGPGARRPADAAGARGGRKVRGRRMAVRAGMERRPDGLGAEFLGAAAPAEGAARHLRDGEQMRRIDGRPVPGARRFRARTARHSGTGRAVRVSRGACSCGAALVLAGALAACSEAPSGEAAGGRQRAPAGVSVGVGDGGCRRVRLQVVADASVRVTATPRTDFANLPEPLMVVAEPAAVPFEAEAAGGVLRLTTPAIDAEVALDTGAVTFRDAAGNVLLAEAERSLAPVTQDPGPVAGDSYAVRQQFHRAEDEALYGLGQHQSGDVNHAGENVTLTTHNVFISIPFLVSTRGWGLLWNNASITRVGSPEPPRPLGDGFELYDAAGEPGALTVRYYAGEDLVLEARAADLDYQYLDHGNVREHPLPEAVADLDDLKITWEGTIIPKRSGTYDLEMYSSGYARLVLDGEALLDRWRVNWNPWYHETKAALEKGQRYRLRVEWDTQGGYFRLLHYPPPAAETLSIASETAKAIDYYFVAGASADEAIAGYRKLTGKAVMLPRWAYGYWQSRERYKTQEDLIGVLEEYRERGIPIDNIVLDWFYWPEDAWGSHAFDAERFPDPRAMVERVHELDAHIMVSVWPKFYPGTDHYRALDEA